MEHLYDKRRAVTNRTPQILLVTRNLPPLIGGMERLNWHVAHELSRFANVRVVGPKGSASRANGLSIDEVGSTKMGAFLLLAFWKCLRVTFTERPAIIFAGSGLTAPIAVLLAKMIGSKSVVYAHGLDLTVDHLVYRKLWLPLISRADTVVVNSSATRELACSAGVPDERIRVVHPGVTMPVDCALGSMLSAEEFRRKHEIDSGKLLISVGRLTPRKGMLQFVRDVLPTVVARLPDCKLLIVGDAPVDALAAKNQSLESIKRVACEVGVRESIRFLGKITDDELSMVYRIADLHVFPVQLLPNDPEGFGMVAIEAAARGVATVAYRVGGVPDAVAQNRSGRLIDQGDAPGFAAAVIALLDRPLPSEEVQAFAKRFAWERIGRELADAIGICRPLDS